MNFAASVQDALNGLVAGSGFVGLTPSHIIMIAVALGLLYLAIVKQYEPLLLLPISFGMLLVNLPFNGLMTPPMVEDGIEKVGGLLYYLYQGDELGIFPPIIFMGVGAMTDFGPLIANPKSILLGAAAQFGVFTSFLLAMLMGFSASQAAPIGIIGGADGPTAIYLTSIMDPSMLGPIAVAAYSYMSLVPIIQPPIMRALTTKEERAIVMEQLRPVSKREKILFPIIVTIIVCLILPSATSLIGMLMLGNLFKESGVVDRLTETVTNGLMNTIVVFLGVTVGATTEASVFLTADTLKIVFLGLCAFAVSTAAGVLLGKLMNKMSGGKVNPLIGAAGVSAVPMAARVAQKVGQEENPNNFLLMHAMGPNVAGVIGTAVAAGVFINMFGN